MNAKIVTVLTILALASSHAVWASARASEQAEQDQQAGLVEMPRTAQETPEHQKLVREVAAAGLHPVVQSMAVVAPDVTEACAMALMSFDRKLKTQLAGGSATGSKKRSNEERREFAARKAEKRASAACDVPYAPCVDAKIERKLLQSQESRDLRAADRNIEKQCDTAT